MMLRQPGPDRRQEGFGTAEKERFDAVELPDSFEIPPIPEIASEAREGPSPSETGN